MTYTLSNFLTITRIVLIPFLAGALAQKSWLIAFILFCCAALTDFFDGYLARLWNQETVLGSYLDPLADKLMIVSCYVALIGSHQQQQIPTWFLLFIIIKELVLLTGALYWGIWQQTIVIKPTVWGKIAMAIQVGFIGFLLLCYQIGLEQWAGISGVVVVVGVVVAWAFVDYAARFMIHHGRYYVLFLVAVGGIHRVINAEEESFLAEPAQQEKSTIKKNKEKKYSELCDELLALHEAWLHKSSELIQELSEKIKDLSQAQVKHLDEVRKIAENRPQASREHVLKEIKRVSFSLEKLDKFSASCS